MDRRTRLRAFTLVELLVVIGIIAVLVGILLPTLSNARERGKAVACQSNLKQLVTAAFTYASENKDSLPFGFTFNRYNPASPTAGPAVGEGGQPPIITWYQALNKYMNKGADIVSERHPDYNWTTLKTMVNAAFRCPSSAPGFNQGVHYYNNGTAMPNLRNEFFYWNGRDGASPIEGGPIRAPARMADCLPETALFWDTPLLSDMDVTQALPIFNVQAGTSVPTSFLDAGAAFQYPEEPATRFTPTPRETISAVRRDDDPVSFWTDERTRSLASGASPSMNADLGGGTILTAMIGNLRFRHNKDKTVNVAFADGSVRTFELNKKRIVADWYFGSNDSYLTDFKVRNYRLKWPSNRRPAVVARFP
jgi:prepilin-type N-terminal cleavage/methylation domain-containing protein/prepilin-type processing-associated H-X9-DG protein